MSRAAIALGWDDSLWSGLAGGPPAVYSMNWDQLSKSEKLAATELCHCNISWPGDGSTIDLWDQYNEAAIKSMADVSSVPIVSLLVLILSAQNL